MIATPPPSPSVADTAPPCDLAALPGALRAGVERHRTHVGELTAHLRAAGLPDATIADSVADLTTSYQDELAAALVALGEDTHG